MIDVVIIVLIRSSIFSFFFDGVYVAIIILPRSHMGAFTYDGRCFLGIFDLPTYPNQMVYYLHKPI